MNKNTWYSFTAYSNDYNQEQSFKLYIERGVDIIERGLKYLQIQLYYNRLDGFTGDRFDTDQIADYFISNGYLTNTDLLDTGAVSNSEIMVPMHQVHAFYKITSIIETVGCQGCEIDAPGQLSHMQCPDGCLHQKEYCDYCPEN